MNSLIHVSSSEIITDKKYAGMTQVMNVHTRTVLATDDGKYLRPDECALIDSRSINMNAAIRCGHFLVLSVVEGEPVVEQSPSKKKKSAQAQTEEVAPDPEITESEAEAVSDEGVPAAEVAPE
jgi:hypothetical protein